MTLVAAVAARLAESGLFGHVGQAADLGRDLADGNGLPSAHVYIGERSAGANISVNAISQQRSVTVNVVVAVGTQANEGDTEDRIGTLLDKLDDLLVGWSPGGRWTPLVAGAGKLDKVTDGVVTRVESYNTTELVRT